MRNIILLLFCFSAPLLLTAQDKQQTPRVDIFGGYSLLHQELGYFSNGSGWEASATYHVNRWLGTTADYSGNYYRSTGVGTAPPSTTPITQTLTDSYYHVLFGPQVSLHTSRFQPFAHALLGVRRETLAIKLSPALDFWPGAGDSSTGNTFSTAFGGGVDVAVSRRIAMRLVQADYLFTPNGVNGVNRNAFRYSAGIVFHLGTAK